MKSYKEYNRLEAGIDEAGRGPLFGRVYAAAVILNPEFEYDFDFEIRFRFRNPGSIWILISGSRTITSTIFVELNAASL